MPVATSESKESILSIATQEHAIHSKLTANANEMELDLESEPSNILASSSSQEEPAQEKPNTDALEISMLSKPAEEKTEAPQISPNPDQHTVIIFDWDDTLLASSFLHQKGYRLDNNLPPCEEVDNGLKQLEASVISVLTLALQYGEVNIVTNAETGWVQLSAQKFMPGVVPLLEKVTVISARSTFESAHPDAPLKWKYHAMHERLSTHFENKEVTKPRHVVSFGDSHVEREAVRQVTKLFDTVRCKSVKFAERPSMEQLRRQIELVTSCFQYIYTHDGDLDLMLTISLMY